MLNLIALSRLDDERLQGDGITHVLKAVRKHLGMEIAYVSRFDEGNSVFREVDAPGLEHLIKVGDSRPLSEVYCQHILDGRLPELIPDTAQNALAHSLPITHAVPIRAHMSVPVRLPDGRAYGMFCCLSPRPNLSLNHRDLEVMRVFADMVAYQIGRDAEAEQVIADAADEIERIIAETAFSVLYQPILGFEPFQVLGFEALCRFSPEPYRSPDVWFRKAWDAGLGPRLELHVLRKAVEALADFPRSIFVSVNASPGTVVAEPFLEALRSLQAERLVLEVTEHAEVSDYGAL